VAYTLTIPQSWSSGIYVARITGVVPLFDISLGAQTEVDFVVKALPESQSNILFEIAANTYQAYNSWGPDGHQQSLYDFNSTDKIPASQVSFNRPGPLSSYRDYAFVLWLEKNDFKVDYCTSIDLHADQTILNGYQLILSVGHHEYWTKEMRDNLEAFIANGGNVAFFSGNVCWWQARLEDSNRSLVCFRDSALDHLTSVDDSRVTVLWRANPVNRPENSLTGVSSGNGAEGPFDPANRPLTPYQVWFGQHSIFANSGVGSGDQFGGVEKVVGYETDGALFDASSGAPVVTGADGTPFTFLVLASADLSDPSVWKLIRPVSLEPNPYDPNSPGSATMGIYRNWGSVFTAATTDWSLGLSDPSSPVVKITRNVLSLLSCGGRPSPKLANSGFEVWDDRSLPLGWNFEGEGSVAPDQANAKNGKSVVLDGSTGETWISQNFWVEGCNFYRIGCWAKCDGVGATVGLQSTQSWNDFAVAQHSGSGNWEFLCAVGAVIDEGPMILARAKIHVDAGVIAWFDDVVVDMV
jgi:hypothetical protein